MKASELRIGNCVKVYWENIHLWGCIDFWEGINFEPIPLTEDWLLKFGFVKEDVFDDGGYLFSYYELVNEKVNLKWNSYNEDGFDDHKHIKHVHSLQNLYFALTGEELTINE